MTPIVCPSGFAFVPRKLTGLLMAKLASKESTDGLADLVAQCCARVEDAGPYALGEKDGLPNWKRVLTGDLTVAMAFIRAISLPVTFEGYLYKWLLKCTNADCFDEYGKRTEFVWTVDIRDVPITKLTDETRDAVKLGNVFHDTLLDGRKFSYKLPTDEDPPVMRRLLSASGIPRTAITDQNARIILEPLLVAARVLSIEGCANVEQARQEIIDADPWTVSDALLKISGQDGGFESFTGSCPTCGTSQDLALPTTPQSLLSRSNTVAKSEASALLEATKKARANTSGLGDSSTRISPG